MNYNSYITVFRAQNEWDKRLTSDLDHLVLPCGVQEQGHATTDHSYVPSNVVFGKRQMRQQADTLSDQWFERYQHEQKG